MIISVFVWCVGISVVGCVGQGIRFFYILVGLLVESVIGV